MDDHGSIAGMHGLPRLPRHSGDIRVQYTGPSHSLCRPGIINKKKLDDALYVGNSIITASTHGGALN